MQHSIALDVFVCLSEKGFSLDELVIKTRELFDREGVSGFLALVMMLVDEHISLGLVRETGQWKPPPCCDQPRYRLNDKLPRQFRTSGGTTSIFWNRLLCTCCGQTVIPLRDFLGLKRYQAKSSELEKIVVEVMSEQSYRRGSGHLKTIGEIPVPKSTAHRWVMESESDAISPEGQTFEHLLVDGTGYKRKIDIEADQTNRGEIRVLLGITPEKRTIPLGAWSGKSWEEIGQEIKKVPEDKWPRAQTLVGDGEPGMAEAFSDFVNDTQRSHWHLVRDMNVMMWQDNAGLEERKAIQEDLWTVLGVELPKEDIEPVTPMDRKELETYVKDAEDHVETLIGRLIKKQYYQAAGYLRRAKEKLFTYVRLWLRSGIVSPRVSSWIERVMREIGRRLKRMAFGWSEKGAEKMTRIILKRFTSQEQWNEYWRKRLCLNDNVMLVFREARVI